ncbi:MAG TPA: MlaE family lipid ABC transporter permease subunit [Syntrophales bacterium]|nr:MlaE family lipid ABC transporter permease subunit [Syntrophales bacterium]
MKVPSSKKKEYNLRIEEKGPGDVVLFVSGRIALDDLNNFISDARSILLNKPAKKLMVDIAGVKYLDSAGTLALFQLEDEQTARSASVTFHGVSDELKGILNLLDKKAHHAPPLVPERKQPNILEQMGKAARMLLDDFFEVMSFVGELIVALIGSLRSPRSLRWNDVLYYMKRAGVDGLPIVGLIGLLMGLIMAFMSSLQLKQFGANIYVASLVAIAMVKELGPIMTSILVAGRSGSAFAAEIGTMIVNDEVNALKAMGFEPVRFLAVPKVLATVIVVPILTVYADLFAILGGLVVGVVGLDLTAYSYIQQTREGVAVFDIVSSMVKSAVFAGLIAGIGCQRGFQVREGAESVGTSTTSAVVSAIFLVIVADSAFAIILHYIR